MDLDWIEDGLCRQVVAANMHWTGARFLGCGADSPKANVKRSDAHSEKGQPDDYLL
jgi:hypothetical protein